jgi:hypothetical protein
MTNLISKAFNGNRVRINPTSKLVCLNDICKADGKQLKNFLRNQNTANFISELSFVAQIRATNLLVEGKGSAPTWGHPQLAIKCAAWCSAKFEVLMTSWVWELFATGKVDLTQAPALPVFLDQSDVERGVQFGKAVAMRAFEGEKLEVPDGWQTIREYLIEIVGDSDTMIYIVQTHLRIRRKYQQNVAGRFVIHLSIEMLLKLSGIRIQRLTANKWIG